MGETSRAAQDFDRALALDPDYAPAYYGRGWVRHYRGDYQGELDDAETAIHLDPGNAEMYFIRLGSAYQGLEQYNKAIDVYTRALNAHPDTPGIALNRGSCYYEMGEHRKAVEDFDR